MSEVTGLRYSENIYDLKLCLFVIYSDWDNSDFREFSFSMPEVCFLKSSIFLLSTLSETLLVCHQKPKA